MKNTQNQSTEQITFVGGGNMASALIKGLLANGYSADHIRVIETSADARSKLADHFSIHCIADAAKDTSWQTSSLIVWAIKPQQMKEVCSTLSGMCLNALHLSVAAGIPTSSLASWLQSERIVRAMPNTPALIGLGQTGLFARAEVTPLERDQIKRLIEGTGDCIWLEEERLLDSVTAISGSGPAYVFYFLEALTEAGVELGLSAEDSKKLSIGTFIGASQLALQSPEPLSTLRERVTSKGGTTEAALNHMVSGELAQSFKAAVKRAQEKAFELGVNYGK